MSENFKQHSYENGSTQPPKNRGALIAVILCATIFLSGLLTVLSLCFPLGFREEGTPILFHDQDSAPSTAPSHSTDQVFPGDGMQIELSPIPENVDNVPQEGGMGLQDIYDRNIPSVVSVTCTVSRETVTGTGVVLSANGYLVTNAHVIDGATDIQILLTDGRTYSAQIVGADSFSDLAVLYIAANDLIPAEFGDSAQVRVGDAVVAIGDPLGTAFRGTMTDGIISAINRNVSVGGRNMSLLQTNAALNSGNSGGPLINCHGQVIGINTMKIGIFADNAGVEGLGFAIPSVIVRDIVNQLINQGYVSGQPALGLTGTWVSLFDQHFRHMPAGLYVTGAPNGSPVLAGDIVLTVDGTRITSEEDLAKVLYAHRAGDQVVLTVYRGGEEISFTVTLTEAGR